MLILHPRCRHSLYAVDFQILTSFGVVPTSLNVIVSLSRLWLLQDETKAHFRCVRVVLFCDSVLFICSLLEWSDYDVVSPCLGPAAWLPRRHTSYTTGRVWYVTSFCRPLTFKTAPKLSYCPTEKSSTVECFGSKLCKYMHVLMACIVAKGHQSSISCKLASGKVTWSCCWLW